MMYFICPVCDKTIKYLAPPSEVPVCSPLGDCPAKGVQELTEITQEQYELANQTNEET